MAVWTWWYDWGMFLFLLLDIVAIFWIFLDSANRRISAIGWRVGSIFPAILILPSVLLKFASAEARLEMSNLIEPFFWAGLFGGIIPIVLAILYAVVAPSALSRVPVPPPVVVPPPAPVVQFPVQPPPAPPVPPRPQKPKAGAWLYIQSGMGAGHSFQLNVGDTRIGRSPDNDIVINDPEVSKGHALIREQGGQFTIQDIGSTNGTFVNEQRLYSVRMLYDGDLIRVGQTSLVFKRAG